MPTPEICPFCLSPLEEGATVCGHCGRDVAFVTVRALTRRLAAAESRLLAQEAQLAELAQRLEAPPAVEAPPAAEAAPAVEAPIVPEAAPSALSRAAAFGWLVLLLGVLLGAHLLIVGIYDLDTRVLRAVSVLLPVPFGLLRPLPARRAALAGLAVGILAAAGMLENTSLLFGEPFLPEDAHDWVEVAQYVACIAFSYFGGSLVGGRWHRLDRIAPLGKSFAVALVTNAPPPAAGDSISTAKRVHATAAWINSMMVVLSAIGAIVTALSQLGHLLP